MSRFKQTSERQKIRREIVPLILGKQMTIIAASKKYNIPKMTIKYWVEREKVKINTLLNINPNAAGQQIFSTLLSSRQITFLLGIDEAHSDMMKAWKETFGNFEGLAELEPVLAEEKFRASLITLKELQQVKINFLKFTMEFDDFKTRKEKESQESAFKRGPIDITEKDPMERLKNIPKSQLSQIQQETINILTNTTPSPEVERIREPMPRTGIERFERAHERLEAERAREEEQEVEDPT